MGEGEVDCYQKIAAGLADFSAFDGGSIFDAGLFLIMLKVYDLVPWVYDLVPEPLFSALVPRVMTLR